MSSKFLDPDHGKPKGRRSKRDGASSWSRRIVALTFLATAVWCGYHIVTAPPPPPPPQYVLVCSMNGAETVRSFPGQSVRWTNTSNTIVWFVSSDRHAPSYNAHTIHTQRPGETCARIRYKP